MCDDALTGPPTTNRPVGLMRNLVFRSEHRRRDDFPDHILDEKFTDVGMPDGRGVPGGHKDV